MRPAARLGDSGAVHCSPFVIASGSPNVFVNGRPAASVGDASSVHLRPVGKKCFPHVSFISSGSARTFVNGKPMAALGDRLTLCTIIASGSPNVFVG